MMAADYEPMAGFDRMDRVFHYEGKRKEGMAKKKGFRKNRIIFFLFLFFFLILILLYLQSPFSKIEEIQVVGNERLFPEEVIAKSGLKVGDSVFFLPSSVSQRMEKDPEIKTAAVIFRFPNRYVLDVKENQIIALIRDGNRFKPILENGVVLSPEERRKKDYPLLTDWKDPEQLRLLCSELNRVSEGIRSQISEIRSIPSQNDRYKVEVYMKDQFEVRTSALHFSQYMNLYPYVKKGLEGKGPGVLTINESGSFYISYAELKAQQEAGAGQDPSQSKKAP